MICSIVLTVPIRSQKDSWPCRLLCLVMPGAMQPMQRALGASRRHALSRLHSDLSLRSHPKAIL